MAAAQDAKPPIAEGYITAVQPQAGFELNGTPVTTLPSTSYRLINSKGTKAGAELIGALRVGAYVEVIGSRAGNTVAADSVVLLEDQDKKLNGFGVIEKVGPENEFQADGYRIRITPNTVTSFHGHLKAMSDVGPNTWIKYEGKREASGVLLASEATFVPARQGKVKAPPRQDAAPSKESLIDADGNFLPLRTKVRMSQAGGACGWHRVPADQALQQRVWRVGMSVVPDFQKQMEDDSPSKIHFRFYAVDEANIRSTLSCNVGLILIPKQAVKRLENDSQLAAVLADGVASSVQWQSARIIAEFREILGAELAGEIALSLVPGVSLAADVGAGIAAHTVEMHMQEQRGRMALNLLADAGYDPWQAPEAWRLLAPKEPTGDAHLLKYPVRSGYQLGILNLQYGRIQAGRVGKVVPPGDGSAQ